MTDYKAMACLGLMYWYFQAENDEEAQKMAEKRFEEIKHDLKCKCSIQSGGVSIVRETPRKD